jgi:uncharacterized membrane protein
MAVELQEGRMTSGATGAASAGEEQRRRERPSIDSDMLARGLGWFSIGLGLGGLCAPRMVGELIGVGSDRTTRNILRAVGLREIAGGVAILGARDPTAGVWARVGGDVIDLALLGWALSSGRTQRDRVAGATAVIAGVTALDAWCGRRLQRSEGDARPSSAYSTKHSIAINRKPKEVYAFWRDFTKLPRFMSLVESIETTGHKRSHWRVKGPAGRTWEWDAEIIEDNPGQMLAWRSLDGADIENAGRVRFERAPGGRGTILKVELAYRPPAGRLGAALARLFGQEPGQILQQDLRAMKALIEAGEIPRSEASFGKLAHAGRPPTPEERESDR